MDTSYVAQFYGLTSLSVFFATLKEKLRQKIVYWLKSKEYQFLT